MALAILHRRQLISTVTKYRVNLIVIAFVIAISSVTTLLIRATHAAPTNYVQTGVLRPHIQLTDSLGMSMDSAGNYYVAETYGFHVRKFSPSGQLLMSFGSDDWSDAADGLGYLMDTAVDSRGIIYVSDPDNYRIQVYDQNGNLLRSIGGVQGTGNGQFNALQALVVDSSDNLYASDGTRIQAFDKDGNFLRSISTPDMTHTYSNGYVTGNIRGLTIRNNILYVSETDYATMSQIQKIAVDGTLLGTFGSYNSASSNPTPGAMAQPQALAVDSLGDIYVDDLDYINRFSSDGTALSKTYIGQGQGEDKGEVQDMWFDSSDNLQILNTRPNRILTLNHGLQYVSEFGQSGLENGYTYGTLGVYRDEAAGRMYVSDAINSRIQVFDLSGNFLSSFGTHGTALGQMNRPGHIAKNPITGNLYVHDFNGIEVWTPDGTFVQRLTGLGSAGIAFDASGKMYTADSTYSGTPGGAIRDNNGNVLNTFGTAGTPATGQISYPSKVSLDSAGNIYVADPGSNYIQIYAPDGTFLRNIGGTSGSGNGQFSQPNDIKIASDGTIYVADTGNHRFQIFDNTGAYVSQFGSIGFGPGKFMYPQSFTIDSDGTMYVADDVNDFVEIYKPSSNTAPSAPQNFTVTGNSSASWQAPVNNGGTAIASYKLRHKRTSASSWIETTLPASATTYSFGAQPNDDTYQYEITATNAAGESVAATPGSSATTPSSPQSVSATSPSANTLHVSWHAPANDGGSAITNYLLEYKPSASPTWSQLTVAASPTNHDLTGVPAGTYDVQVSAINGTGTSSPSGTVTATVADPAPSSPAPAPANTPTTAYVAPPAIHTTLTNTDTQTPSNATSAPSSTATTSSPSLRTEVSTSQPGSITITWQPPTGDTKPVSYVIEYRDGSVPESDTTTPWRTARTALGSETSAEINLPAGTYNVRVAALMPGETASRIVLGVAHITVPAREATIAPTAITATPSPNLALLISMCVLAVVLFILVPFIIWKRRRKQQQAADAARHAQLPPRWQ